MRILFLLVAGACLVRPAEAQDRQLLIVSIDGLDHRYLKDRDSLKLRIPNLRKLVEQGAWADGVVGIVPTVTWPSHTTLITGVRADEHGILDNNIQTANGSERYWYAAYLKAPTLWQAAKKSGKRVAAITWPVTVGAEIDYNLPEYFRARSGGAMDLKSTEEKATPGLVQAITAEFPSFATQWMDDRVRALATIYILKRYQPDLTLLHFVDHDEAAHDMGPFSKEAIATLEYTDELLGQILAVAPRNTVVAIVSDHGFEAAPRELNVASLLASKKLPAGGAVVRGGFLTTYDPAVAAALSEARSDERSCVGREIPRSEVDRFLPGTPSSARLFEPASGCFFAAGKPGGEIVSSQPSELGRHGHWPTRYRAVFVLSGPGVAAERRPEMDMRDAVQQFARVLGLAWPPRP
jgi:hypothetical protein